MLSSTCQPGNTAWQRGQATPTEVESLLLKTQYPKERMRKAIRPEWALDSIWEVTVVTPGKALTLTPRPPPISPSLKNGLPQPDTITPQSQAPVASPLYHIHGQMPCQGQELGVPSLGPHLSHSCPCGLWASIHRHHQHNLC